MNAHSNSYATKDRGAGLAEYAILLVLIAVACVAVLTTLGATINGMLAEAADMF